MHEIERELIKVTGYKPKRKFSDREDYLKSLLNDVMKLSDDDFDNLSDDAATWANAAVDAHNSKHGTIPDFDQAIEEVDAASEADQTDDEATDTEEVTEDEDASDNEDETSEETPEVDEPEDEDEPASKPAKKKVVSKAKEKTTSKVPPKKEIATPKKTRSSDDEDVVLDKWGCMEGSKNAQALAMFERGATTKEVKDEIGGTYYNILKKAELNGHKLEKDGAIIKLTHKNANKAPVKKKK